MGQFYDSIPTHLLEWLTTQHVFWVATAPLSADGHVNVSPKGTFGSFHVVNANQVWYEDQTGSGVETIAHLRENGRITLLFCAFDGPPRIVRLLGKGTVHEFGTPEFEERLPFETRKPGLRSAIIIDVHKVGTSCGFGVPFYNFQANRTELLDTAYMFEQKEFAAAAAEPQELQGKAQSVEGSDVESPPPPYSKDGLRAYWASTNAKSIDGLPGLLDALSASYSPRGEWNDEMKKFIKEGAGIESSRSGKSKENTSSDKSGVAVASPSGDGGRLFAAFALGTFASLLIERLIRMA